MQAIEEERELSRLAGQPSWLLTRVSAVAHRLVTEGFARAGTRGYHYRLLAALDELGPSSQADLGRKSGIYLSDVVAAVNELEASGFVTRSSDPVDRRRNVISLLDAGRGQLSSLDDNMVAIQESLVAPLSDAESRELRRLLEKLLAGHRFIEHQAREAARLP